MIPRREGEEEKERREALQAGEMAGPGEGWGKKGEKLSWLVLLCMDRPRRGKTTFGAGAPSLFPLLCPHGVSKLLPPLLLPYFNLHL